MTNRKYSQTTSEIKIVEKCSNLLSTRFTEMPTDANKILNN